MNSILQEILYSAAIVILPMLARYVIKCLESFEIKNYNDITYSYIEKAKNTIMTVVAAVNQTYTENLKNSGNFTEEEQKKAFEKAKETALKMFGEETKKAIESIYSDLDTFLTAQIEKAVNEIKKEREKS